MAGISIWSVCRGMRLQDVEPRVTRESVFCLIINTIASISVSKTQTWPKLISAEPLSIR